MPPKKSSQHTNVPRTAVFDAHHAAYLAMKGLPWKVSEYQGQGFFYFPVGTEYERWTAEYLTNRGLREYINSYTHLQVTIQKARNGRSRS